MYSKNVTHERVKLMTFKVVKQQQNMSTIKSKIIQPFRIIADWEVQSKKLKETFSQLANADFKLETIKRLTYLSG